MEIHRIRKTGGSYTVVIPKKFLTHLGVVANDYVVCYLRDKKIEIEPLEKFRKGKKLKKRR